MNGHIIGPILRIQNPTRLHYDPVKTPFFAHAERHSNAVLPHLHQRLECDSSSAASFASGGGGSGGECRGGEGAYSGDVKPNLVVGAAERASSLSSDVIIMDVGV